MTSTATVRVMSAEEIAAQAGGETPFVLLPERATLFAERAMRLRQLAAGHAMGDFLRFMADVALAQQGRLTAPDAAGLAALTLASAEQIDHAAKMGLPPLPAVDWPRDGVWRDELRTMLGTLRQAAPEATRVVIDGLVETGDDELERQADALLHGVMHGVDLAAAPFVGAALQLHFTRLVLATQASHGASGSPFGRIDDAGLCPCCGSRPVASVIRMSAPGQQLSGQRYLQCSLCSTQWHRRRIQCTHCGSDKTMAYESLQRADAAEGEGVTAAAVQAETCDDCGHYLKLMHADRDPMVDAVADDLATVTLDLLVAESGRQRHGVNLLLLFGDPGPEPDTGGR